MIWQVGAMLLGGAFVATFIHEMGHVLIGWLYGSREANIHFGHPADRSVRLSLRCLTVHFHLGVSLLLMRAICRFDRPRDLSPWSYIAVKAAGPLASLATYWLLQHDLLHGLHQFFTFNYPVNSPRTSLAFWSLFFFITPLIPMRLKDLNSDSDGLGILATLLELMRGKQARG